MTVASIQEGFIPFKGYNTWYRIVSNLTGQRVPLLVLHGGPGATHYGLLPLEKLVETGRPVIFYDQLGCGNSDKPDDDSLWSIQLFLEELATLRRELALDRIHLLGHSWGGMLAMEYVLTEPRGVLSLTLASSIASGAIIPEEQRKVKEQLPAPVRDILLNQPWSEDLAYQQALAYFDRLHSCRHEPWEGFWQEAYKRMNIEVNMKMWVGELRSWDIRPRLDRFHLPVLITTGRYDGMATRQDELLYQGIRHARHIVFDDSSHFAHAEETDRYIKEFSSFLDSVEQSLMT